MNNRGHNSYDGAAVLFLACLLAFCIGVGWLVKQRIQGMQRHEEVSR